MNEELDKEQIKEDLLFMIKEIVDATKKLEKVYNRMTEIYKFTFENEKTNKKTD